MAALDENGSRPAEITRAERRRRILAVLLAFGAPLLFVAIAASAVWLEEEGFISRSFAEWLVLVNGAFAAAGSAAAPLIRPGTSPAKRSVGVVAGAVAGLMMYFIYFACFIRLAIS